MRKNLVLFLILTIGASLAACSASQTTSGSTGNLSTSYTSALSVQSQLAIGTIKLEGTSNPVNNTQASQLLVLWKAIRTLNSASSTSPVEINAVVDQIQQTLTPEQVKAIAAFKLTQANGQEIVQSFGAVSTTPQTSPTRMAVPSSGGGGPGGGAPPDGGGGMPPGGGAPGGDMGAVVATTPNASTQATSQARATVQAGSVNDSTIINLVIAFLEKRAAE